MRYPAGIAILLSGLLLAASCKAPEDKGHYFLRGYDQLEFRNSLNGPVPVSEFMEWRQLNGVQTYQILDEALRLVYRKDGTPYTGPIRTFHWYTYNIEALFEEGKIYRMRYWHPNRQLGMDADYVHDVGTVWNRYGLESISWNSFETIYKNPSTGQIRQIITDSLTSYYDLQGDLRYYSFRTDTAWQSYFPDGNPRFFFPINQEGERDGRVLRWYPNGQLRVEGFYKNGEEYGVWIEYDTLGTVLQRVIMGEKGEEV